MTENPPNSSEPDSIEKAVNENEKESSPDPNSSNYVDMLLSRRGAKVVDSETLVKEAQKRVWASLKQRTCGICVPTVLFDWLGASVGRVSH